jgi:hypothetical protein
VQAMSVNEWPAPATRTRRAPATIAASASSEPGRSMRSGAQRCCPAQLVQSSGNRSYDDEAVASVGAQCASGSGGVSRRYHSASSAAMHPLPAAVTAWR